MTFDFNQFIKRLRAFHSMKFNILSNISLIISIYLSVQYIENQYDSIATQYFRHFLNLH
jgi:hypothetical protein